MAILKMVDKDNKDSSRDDDDGGCDSYSGH